MCYHTHSSPNESIDFAVLWCTQSIDSFGKNGDIFSICTIYIFQTFFGTFPMTFLQKFSNQKVQFSIKINNIPKKPFEKSVRNISIHLLQQFQMNRQILQFLEFYRRNEKLLGLDFNQFSNFFLPSPVGSKYVFLDQAYKCHLRGC